MKLSEARLKAKEVYGEAGSAVLRQGIATQKKIDKQHAEVFTPATIDELKTLAVAHYASDQVAA